VVDVIPEDENQFLFGYGLFHPVSTLLGLIGVAAWRRPDEESGQ
jgi:hypothetical protein